MIELVKISINSFVWIIDDPDIGYHRSMEYTSKINAYIAMLSSVITWTYSEGGIIIEE